MIRCHNIDCMDFMANVPDQYYDLAIVDPPYGIGENGQRNISMDRPSKKWKKPNSKIYHTFDDSKPPDQKYFEELFRVSKHQIIWGGNYFALPPSSGWIVWDKCVQADEPLGQCELAWTSFQCRIRKFTFLWAGFKKAIQEKRIHPTQKPVALYKWLMTKFAKPGWKLLDTHGGSFSSAIAAHELGFDLDICEIDADYFKAGKERLDKIQQQLFLPIEEATQGDLV